MRKLTSSQLQLDFLREQIEMRVIGLSWIEFKTKWSSGKDEEVGTIDDLKGKSKPYSHMLYLCFTVALTCAMCV